MSAGNNVLVVDSLNSTVIATDLVAAEDFNFDGILHAGSINSNLVGGGTMMSLSQFSGNSINMWSNPGSIASVYLPTLQQFMTVNGGALSRQESFDIWLVNSWTATPNSLPFNTRDNVKFSNGHTTWALHPGMCARWTLSYGHLPEALHDSALNVIITPTIYDGNTWTNF